MSANILDSLPTELWLKRLQVNDKGIPIPNAHNVAISLEYAPDLAGCVRLDDFSQQIMLVGRPPWEEQLQSRQWRDSDDTELLVWLQQHGLQLRGVATVTDAVRMVAKRHSYDPLREWLEGLEWDGSYRLESWLSEYLGADLTPLNRATGRAFLISAVARALEPGCQVDHVLCLESSQGAGKTETVRCLGGEFTQEHLPDMHTKDGMSALAGVWIVELSELAAMSRSEVEAVKSFISRRVDRYRPAYGRHTIEQPRRCVFVATTNEGQYLRDRTGNRRFWPVKCGDINLKALAEDRDQLFAEAVYWYKAGEAWHFSDEDLLRAAKAEQLKRVEHDPWLTDMSELVDGRTSITTSEILQHLDIERGRSSAPHAKRIAGIMREMGWNCSEDQSAKSRGGKREVIWKPAT